MSAAATLAVVAALLVLLAVLLVGFARLLVHAGRTFRCRGWIRRGDYARARAGLEPLAGGPDSLPWVTVGVRTDARQALVACDFEEGAFDACVARAKELEVQDRNPLRNDVLQVIAAAALVLGGKDPSEARARLEAVVGRRETRNVVLLLAHALLSEGDEEAARAVLATASTAGGPSLVWAGFVPFEGIGRSASSEAFLRGWFFVRTGELERAKPLLAQAAAHKVPNAFSKAAANMLAAG